MAEDDISLRRVSEYGVEYPLGHPSSAIVRDFSFLMAFVYERAKHVHIAANPTFGSMFCKIEASMETLFAAEGRVTYPRRNQVCKEITQLATLLGQFYNYMGHPHAVYGINTTYKERFARKFNALNKRLVKLARPMSNAEFRESQRYSESPETSVVYLPLEFSTLPSMMAEAFRERLDGLPEQNISQEKPSSPSKTEDKDRTVEGFAVISPDLAEACRLTLDLAEEVAGLETLTVEDEYFVEQVHADYIPTLLSTMEELKAQRHGLADEETAVAESIKQFRIIQAGLQRIIDRTVKNYIDKLNAQTAFLTQKVLGDDSLTLDFGEARTQLEATAEEAARIREGLYQKHVAPVLRAQKEECDERVAVLTEQHAQELKALEADHRVQITQLQSQLKEQEHSGDLDYLLRRNTKLKVENTKLQNLANVQKKDIETLQQELVAQQELAAAALLADH